MKEIILNDEKEIKNFIKKLNNINQDFKRIYCNETNFSPIYILQNKKVLYINKNTIPEILEYKLYETITEFENFQITINSVPFFKFVKDLSKEVIQIIIKYDSITFYGEGEKKLYKLENDLSISSNIFSHEKKFEKFMVGDWYSFLCKIDIDKKYIKEILNTKDNQKYILDLDNNSFYKDSERNLDEVSYLPIFINKKFINGAFYKEKKLKKGVVEEFSPMYINIYPTTRDDIYIIRLSVMTKIGCLEHKFMVCDY